MADLQGVLNGTVSMNSKAGKIVQELLQNESRASGIGDWESVNAKQEYLSKVSPALYNLIGQSTITPMEDFKARTDLQGRWQSRHIAEQGEQTRRNQTHAAALSEAAAKRAQERQIELLQERARLFPSSRTPGKSGSKGSGGTEYSYDRPDIAYYEGRPVSVIKSKDTNQILIDGKAQEKLADLTVRFSRTNPNDVEFWYEGKKVASFNTARPNGMDGVWYLDKNNRGKAAHGNSTMGGIFKDVSAKDLRLMADAIVKNKGSENQYDYGITEDGVLYSVQNQAQRVTKGYDASDDLLQSLWADIGYGTPNYGTYGQDADLNLW